uniref:Uncharacterized protein n=1 Tax=Timema genevievae TaxID=629358 RepID=A0A7R9JT58_TIMGE|nr:unnamed protein product [Timema genevievae]
MKYWTAVKSSYFSLYLLRKNIQDCARFNENGLFQKDTQMVSSRIIQIDLNNQILPKIDKDQNKLSCNFITYIRLKKIELKFFVIFFKRCNIEIGNMCRFENLKHNGHQRYLILQKYIEKKVAFLFDKEHYNQLSISETSI